MPYETAVDLGNFIAALRQADLVDLKWGDRGMLCGNPLPENPKVLTLIVADEADAWIIRKSPTRSSPRLPRAPTTIALSTDMPGNPKAIVAEAERLFPVRIVIKVPPGGIGTRYMPMTEWLDENCGIRGWSITPAGTRGVLNDAFAVYMNGPTCAVAFVARWCRPKVVTPEGCVPGDPPGFYELRQDEPARRMPSGGHSSPPRGP